MQREEAHRQLVQQTVLRVQQSVQLPAEHDPALQHAVRVELQLQEAEQQVHLVQLAQLAQLRQQVQQAQQAQLAHQAQQQAQLEQQAQQEQQEQHMQQAQQAQQAQQQAQQQLLFSQALRQLLQQQHQQQHPQAQLLPQQQYAVGLAEASSQGPQAAACKGCSPQQQLPADQMQVQWLLWHRSFNMPSTRAANYEVRTCRDAPGQP